MWVDFILFSANFLYLPFLPVLVEEWHFFRGSFRKFPVLEEMQQPCNIAIMYVALSYSIDTVSTLLGLVCARLDPTIVSLCQKLLTVKTAIHMCFSFSVPKTHPAQAQYLNRPTLGHPCTYRGHSKQQCQATSMQIADSKENFFSFWLVRNNYS